MARKFGQRKQISVSPLDYNIGIAGISGVGKSTLVKNVCEKLVGEDGYLMLDIGKEDGHSCLTNVASEKVEDWDKLDEVLDEIIDNRTTDDWKDLKVVVFDTLDELFNLGEQRAIAKWNREHPDKRCNSINELGGGFGRGLDMVIDLVLNRIWSLKEVGLSFIVITHTKSKDIEDPITGQTYQVITANMSQRYFNAIKTKLDILGVCYIDRNIIKEKIDGRKDIKGKDVTRNIVAGEARKIAFRSDDFNLDSKCRFPAIKSEVNLDADEFIEAITDAIKAEQAKSGKSFEQSEAEQKAAQEKRMAEIAEQEEKNRQAKEVKEVIDKIKEYITQNKSDMSKIKPLLTAAKNMGYANPIEIDKLEDALEVAKLIG